MAIFSHVKMVEIVWILFHLGLNLFKNIMTSWIWEMVIIEHNICVMFRNLGLLLPLKLVAGANPPNKSIQTFISLGNFQSDLC